MKRAASWLAALGAAFVMSAVAGVAVPPAPPWRFAGLPDQALPKTRFDAVEIDGRRVLRIESAGSYGNLVHPVDGQGGILSWDWRIDRPVAGADLRRKESDDTALKVCAMFDLPLDALPFLERQKLRLARGLSGEALPGATLCYVWAPSLPAGTVLPNIYTARLRWMVLQGAGAPLGRWASERRDLQADLKRAFGDEVRTPPPLIAIVIGADTDNTGGRALGFVADLGLQP